MTLFEREDQGFSRQIDNLRNLADTCKNEFLNIKKQERWSENFLRKMCESYSAMALFPDDEIIQKFLDLGLPTKRLIWLIPVKDIETEMTNIVNTGKLYPLRSLVLSSIKLHLDCKIYKEMLEELDLMTMHKGKLITRLELVLRNAVRRKRESGDGPTKFRDETDFKVYNMLSGFSKPGQQGAVNVIKGDASKYYLRPINNFMYKIEPVSKREFSRIMYNFYKLLLPDDKTWYNYDEFLDYGPKKASYSRYQHTKFTNTFRR